jgi:hypothetical protein
MPGTVNLPYGIAAIASSHAVAASTHRSRSPGNW